MPGPEDETVEALARETAALTQAVEDTRGTLAKSAELIAGMRAGLDAGHGLSLEAAVEARLDAAGLNEGQREAARTILLSPHRTVGVQGHAGSGKTTMLRALRELAEERRIVGLAPSASAVRALAGEADLPARTLQGFLARYRDVGDGIALPEKTQEARQALGGAMLILDEASMVGTMQMRALTRVAENTAWRGWRSSATAASCARWRPASPSACCRTPGCPRPGWTRSCASATRT